MAARWPNHFRAWVVVSGLACTSPPPPMGSELASALRSTTLEWRAADRRYTLEAEGWRSFQPIQKQDGGDPLIVVVRLNADSPIPDAVSIIEIQLVKDEAGGEVLEYALIAGLIVVAAIAVIGSVGTKVLARWTSLNAGM